MCPRTPDPWTARRPRADGARRSPSWLGSRRLERHGDDEDSDYLPTVYSSAADVAAVAVLAEAERATARRTATPAQAEGVEAAGASCRTEDRVAGWRDRPTPPPPGP